MDENGTVMSPGQLKRLLHHIIDTVGGIHCIVKLNTHN